MAYYISDSGQGCFPVALVNLLSELRDIETAEKVVRHYDSRKNQLITKNDLAHSHVCTRLVADLTEGMYEGTLRFGGLHDIDLEESLGEVYGDKIEFPLQIAREEEAQRRIIQNQEIIAYKGPALVLIHSSRGNNLKWIVDSGKGYCVEGGYMKRYRWDDLPLIGVMLVQNKINPLPNNFFCDRTGKKLEY